MDSVKRQKLVTLVGQAVRLTTIASALAAGSSGCSSKSSGTAPIPASELPSRVAEAYCTSLVGCCQRFSVPYDATACRDAIATAVAKDADKNAATGRVEYDPVSAAACVDATAAAFRACTDRQAFRNIDDAKACKDAYRGLSPLGGPCDTTQECAQVDGARVSCDQSKGGQGKCTTDLTPSSSNLTAAPHGKLNDKCGTTCQKSSSGSVSCDFGLVGTIDTTVACWIDEGLVCHQGSCQKLPGLGDRCPELKCAEGAFCKDRGSCVARADSGPCQGSRECTSNHYCTSEYSISNGQCLLRKMNGESCKSASECVSAFCDSDICRDWSVATSAMCAGKGF